METQSVLEGVAEAMHRIHQRPRFYRARHLELKQGKQVKEVKKIIDRHLRTDITVTLAAKKRSGYQDALITCTPSEANALRKLSCWEYFCCEEA